MMGLPMSFRLRASTRTRACVCVTALLNLYIISQIFRNCHYIYNTFQSVAFGHSLRRMGFVNVRAHICRLCRCRTFENRLRRRRLYSENKPTVEANHGMTLCYLNFQHSNKEPTISAANGFEWENACLPYFVYEFVQ